MIDRPISRGLDDILGERFDVLDHGFVRVVDYMGNDSAVVQAARVSYGAGTRTVRDDLALIRYLLRRQHTTPFEMCEVKLHVKLPIFVARQWIRHRTASVNEYSARYSVLDREFYVPEAEAIAAQSATNRQGRGDAAASNEAEWVRSVMSEHAGLAYDGYLAMLNEEDEAGVRPDVGRQGIARELARANLPVSFYTQWYWKVNLLNLMRFLELRADPHAQWEIRQYAEIILEMMRRWVPVTFEAFQDYRVGRTELSREAARIVKAWVTGQHIDRAATSLSDREWKELAEAFGRPA